MASPIALPTTLALCFVVASAGDAAGQSRETTQRFTVWGPTQWSKLEYRTRCEGGITGLTGGPIKWRVEFRNRAKEPVSFDYSILSPNPRARSTFTGRETVDPGKTFTKIASIDARACADGVRVGLSKVRFGRDEENVPYAPPDRRPG